MKLLLDTHIFLWYIAADARLSKLFRDAIRDPNNEVFLSVASLWEIIIKYQLGKLPFAAIARHLHSSATPTTPNKKFAVA